VAIQDELKLFVEEFKRTNGRIPTQNEIVKGTGRASKTIKSYLVEDVDYAKPLTKLEAAKLGGKKPTGITEVSDDLVKQFKDLKFTHISPSVSTAPSTGSKSFRVRFTGPIANDFKDIFMPATEENLQKITNQIDDTATSNLYKNKAKQFKTEEQFRKLRRLKDAMYRKKDPYGVYENLRKHKSKIFPGDVSKDIQIQHGQPKFSTQTLSRFGFIPKEVNISPEVEKVERIRNEKLSTITKKLKNPNVSIGDKEKLIDQFNDTMKGLRGQLKGTKGQGLVNFELLNIDQDGTVTKLKDTGFDPKRGLVASDEDLSKITKERADELIKLGKEKIDAEAVKLKLIPASKLPQPEKSILRNEFKEANVRWNNDVGAFETPNGNVATQEDLKLYAEENPMEVKVGEEPPTPNKSVLKTVGKTLAKVGAPLPTALIDGYFINKQMDEGKSTAEIAKDPLNWIGLAAMEPLSKVSGIAESGGLNKALRLGLNPATIRGISRFAGLPGLAISTAMTAYDQYKKYQNEEGFVYNLFNKEGN
jgi:hypothetical protein